MLKKFFKENFIIICCSAAAALVLGGFLWALIALRGVGSRVVGSAAGISSVPLILHFNDISGITNVGRFGVLYFVLVLALLIVGMNFAIAREFANRNRFLGHFTAAVTLLFGILLFIAFAAIINVNI